MSAPPPPTTSIESVYSSAPASVRELAPTYTADGNAWRRQAYYESKARGCCSGISSFFFRILSSIPRRCVGRSGQEWLKFLGYDHVLAIRSWTHAVLWFSVACSFCFGCFWAVDVLTLRCCENRLNIPGFGGIFTCMVKAFGVFIMFTGFFSTLEMLGYYDDDTETLLKQKTQVLHALEHESMVVIELARKITKELLADIVRREQEFVRDFLRDQGCILLRFENIMSGASRFPNALEDLPRRLQSMPADIVGLARYLRGGLILELRDVHAENPHIFGEEPTHEKFLQDWDEYQRQSCGETDLSTPLLQPDVVFSDKIFQPLKELTQVPDRVWEWYKGEVHKAEGAGSFALGKGIEHGFGTPPGIKWYRCCVCYIPRCISQLCSCVARCCCCSVSQGTKRRALNYTPAKVFRIGCFWFSIQTKLQERLLHNFILCCVYLCIRVMFMNALFGNWVHVCNTNAEPFDFSLGPWNITTVTQGSMSLCWLETSRHVGGLLGLAAYALSLLICLYNIRRLDKMQDIMTTIRELGGIQRTVRAFNRQMELMEKQSITLRVLESRVLLPMRLVAAFNRQVVQCDMFGETEQETRALQLMRSLDEIDKEMGPFSEYMQKDQAVHEQRRRACENIVQACEARRFNAVEV